MRQEVYQGMALKEVVAAWDIVSGIENPDGWLRGARDRAVAAAAKLDFVHDISYGPEEVQKLDIYPAAEKGPVLVDIHGGM